MDVRTDEGRGLVAGGEHLDFRVEVVDVVERDRFRCFGFDGRTELAFAVMGCDEVEQVEPDLLRWGLEIFPVLRPGRREKIAPEFVDEFDPDRDVPPSSPVSE